MGLSPEEYGSTPEEFCGNSSEVDLREQGWRSSESTHLPPMWPRFDSRTRRHMWVEFVVGSLLCSERFFSGYSGFPLFLNSNSIRSARAFNT